MPEPAFDVPDSSPPPGVLTGSTGKGDSPASGGPAKSFDDLTSDKYDAITKADTRLVKEKIGAEGGMAAAKLAQLAAKILTPVICKPGLGGYQLVYDDIRKTHPELPNLLLMEDESRI